MTVDIRAAARDEAFMNHYSHKRVPDRYDADLLIEGFQAGAVWAQAQLTPTREQIADLLDAHNYDYNQSACRGCDYVNNNGDHDFWHLADVLLDLITRAAK